MIRVLVVDPDLSVRVVLQRLLGRDAEFAVIGEARNGREALAQVARQPDVVLLAASCVERDGEPLKTLRMLHLLPVVVMAGAGDDELTQVAQALGVRAVVMRPERRPGGVQFADAAAEKLVEALRFHARSHSPEDALRSGERRILAIGASTGGPQAVMQVLSMLPPGLGLSVLVVQHMATGLMAGYADWLDRDSPLSVRLARGGERLIPGMVLVAPGGAHLRLHRGQLQIGDDPPVNSCRPSVDVLFESLAKECPASVVAVLLTGIGRDGARGMVALRDGGAHTIAQDEASCVVYGMPRAAVELDAVDEQLPLEAIAPAIVRQFDIGR